jgi:hypothetical protein
MNRNSTRTAAIVGTTLALVLAGTAAVSAAGPRDDDRGPGFAGRGMAGMDNRWGGEMMHGDRGMMRGEPGVGGLRGEPGVGGLRGIGADFERTERTVQTADGMTSVRVEQGIADSASDSSLSFSLGSGETVSVVIDEDTEVYALEEQEVTSNRGWSRTRMVPTQVDAAAIEAGSEIVVWSDSEDGADFVASRVLIQPATADDTVAADEPGDDAAAADETTEEAAPTDA